MKKKILFINPNNHIAKSIGNTYSFHFPPTSLISLAAYTDENLWEMDFLDEIVDPWEVREADIVAVTSTTFTINRAYEIAEIYQKKGVHTVIGGYHATFIPDEAAGYFDTIITGEAEDIWPQFLSDFLNGMPEKLYHGSPVDLNILKTPRHDLISEKYSAATVQTSRGCPMNCAFCTVTKFAGSKYRQRPVDSVIKELQSIKASNIIFVDDNIVGVGKKDYVRAKELFSKMIELKLNKRWVGFTSINIVEDEEVLELAKRSGCYLLNIGLESDSISSFDNINKKQNIRIYNKYSVNQALDIIHKHGIGVYSTLIFGFDTDQVEDLKKRIKFIKRSKVDAYAVAPMTPLPGSDIFKVATAENRLIYHNFPQDWVKFGVVESTMKPALLSIEELDHYLGKAFLSSYKMSTILIRYLKSIIWLKDVRIAKSCKDINMSLRKFYLNK